MLIKKIAIVGTMTALGLLLSSCTANKTAPSTQSTPVQEQATSPAAEGAVVVSYTASGFSPNPVTVKSGQKISWVNQSSAKMQVGSDPHPIHSANDELTNGQFVMELEPGTTVAVVLTKTGTWGYHDHLNPGQRGKVVVE